ncbi:MAG: autotransporter domain-containing protein [Xanthomonadales bacterium]|nr:autotransporter domain-containing protein [Xanthomonadales bacterium]
MIGLLVSFAWPGLVMAQQDGRPVLSIAVSRAVATEGSQAPVTIDLVLDRPAPEGGVCIDLDLVGGTARPGEDFNSNPSVPPIPQGQTMASLPIQIVDDNVSEPDETVRIVLRPSPCYALGPNTQFDLLIRDDDDDPASLQDRLQVIINNTPDPLIASQLVNLAQLCATDRPPQGSELDRRCQLLRLALRDPQAARQLVDTLRGVVGEELSSQRRGFRMLAGGQMGAIARRLDAVRHGGGTGLSLTDVSVEGVHAFLPAAAEEAGDDLLGSGWGLFASASIGDGRRDTTSVESGYRSDSQQLTLGFDRRIDANWVIGAALGRTEFEADLDGDSGDIDMDQTNALIYLSYSAENGWVDGSFGFGNGELDQTRVARFEAVTDDESLSAVDILRGSADTDLSFASVGAGYDFREGGFTIGPRLALEYAKLDIDAFAEQAVQGSDAFAVALDRQSIRSLLARMGLSASWTVSWSGGVLLPQIELHRVLQLEDEAEALTGRFVNDTQGPGFSLPTSPIDDRYAEAAVSLSALFPHGISGFISYRRLFSLQDTEQDYWSLGLRIEL